MELKIKIGGMAGQGVFVTGKLLGKLFSRGGYYVFGYPEYPSLIRGGHNAYQVRISGSPVFSPRADNDILLAIDKEALLFHKDTLNDNGVVFAEESLPDVELERGTLYKLPALKTLDELGAPVKMLNTFYVATILGALKYPVEIFEEVLREIFSSKSEEVVEMNLKVARTAYKMASELDTSLPKVAPIGRAKFFASGNEFAGLGFVKGGLKIYAAYPMTPSSSLLHYLVSVQKKAGIGVIQAEDEIAAINYAVGANFAGVRAATGTSGGGFALMTETVGMAALAETPLVVYLAQRVGPSTGMPTWTEQGDLFQALGASQGEFLRILLAPNTIEEMYYIFGDSLNLAEEFQLPVIILGDKFLAESSQTVDSFGEIPIRRGKLILSGEGLKPLALGERFKRYELTEDGISRRTVPGVPNGMHVATSYEHLEDSFTTEDFRERKKQVDKRMKKLDKILERAKKDYFPKVEGDENADVSLLVWGSQYSPAKEALEELMRDYSVNLVAFNWLYPLSEFMVEPLRKSKVVIAFENNATAQFSRLLRAEVGFFPTNRVLKYTGRQFFPEQIVKAFKHLHKGGFEEKEIKYEEDFELYEFYAPWRYKMEVKQ